MRQPAFVARVDDFLAGLQAAKRSEHTVNGYRNNLLKLGWRMAEQLHGGGDDALKRVAVRELDQRAMRRGFAAWASDHAEGSMMRAWGTWNRFFAYLVEDEALERNPMKSVPKPKLPQTAPRTPHNARSTNTAKPSPTASVGARVATRVRACCATVQNERTPAERAQAAQERAARRSARANKPARRRNRRTADVPAPRSRGAARAASVRAAPRVAAIRQATSRGGSSICTRATGVLRRGRAAVTGFGGAGLPAALRGRAAVVAAAASVAVFASVVVALKREGSEAGQKRISAMGGAASATAARTAKPAPLPELPGGGRRIFPDRRVVAFYGNPAAAALGVLGIGKPSTMIAKLRRQAKPYERKTRPVLPALELISSIAANAPGNDGRYVNHVPAEIINRYLRAARKAKALLILDIQPGHADFMSQTRRLRRWLKEPDVGLAIDPEWHTPGVVPGTQLGSVTAGEVNQVTRYVAKIVREGRLPQKLFIIHQFTQGMVRNKNQLQTPPELAVTMNVDGFGTRSGKLSKYKDFTHKRNRPTGTHVGFKLFYREDTNLYTPKAVMALKPRPDLVMYE